MDTEIIISGDEIIKLSGSYFQGLREAAFNSILEHPHIIKFKTVEYLDINTLKITMKRYQILKDINVNLDILVPNIIDALGYLHENHISQNDLKPDNIVYDPDKNKYLLIDFGVASVYSAFNIFNAGTPTTVAQEIVQSQSNISDPIKSQIFSLGATIYILITGIPWWWNSPAAVYFQNYYGSGVLEERDLTKVDTSYQHTLEEYQRRSFLQNVLNSKWFSLIERCTRFNPKERPSIDELCQEFNIFPLYKSLRCIPKISGVKNMKLLQKEFNTVATFTNASTLFLKNAEYIFFTYLSLKPKINAYKLYSLMFTSIEMNELIFLEVTQCERTLFEELIDDLWEEFLELNSKYRIYRKPDVDYKETEREIASTLNFNLIFNY